MKTILIIYAVGVLINAFAAASIYDDLKEDRQLERVRMVALAISVLASFGTWVYMIVFLFVRFIISLFRKPKKDGRQEEKAS